MPDQINPFNPRRDCQATLASLKQDAARGDRPPFPTAVFNLIQKELHTCVELGDLSQEQVTQAINAYKKNLPKDHTPDSP